MAHQENYERDHSEENIVMWIKYSSPKSFYLRNHKYMVLMNELIEWGLSDELSGGLLHKTLTLINKIG